VRTNGPGLLLASDGKNTSKESNPYARMSPAYWKLTGAVSSRRSRSRWDPAAAF